MSAIITETNKPHSPLRLLVVLAVASSLAPVSMDFFAPSMPGAMRELGVTANAVKSTLYLFLLGYAVAPFLWGAMADRIGRRKVMLAGLSLYIVASMGCYLAAGIVELSLMRLFQGIGSACGVVLARTVLRDIHGPAGATRAIYCLLWQRESKPVLNENAAVPATRWLAILLHPDFIRNSLANTFCITAMLLFLANCSFLTEKYYQLDSSGSGFVLAVFNASITAGVFLVRIIVPRLGVENSVRFGLVMALTGWLSLLLLVLLSAGPPTFALIPIAVACIGTGMVISLTIGQALIPFTFNAGAASALFIFVQSAAASIISFMASQLVETTLISISLMLAVSSLAGLMSMLMIKSHEPNR
jgi:DHA1 family bicyclomycin/chloramphenicol resistance-like MFS transporter